MLSMDTWQGGTTPWLGHHCTTSKPRQAKVCSSSWLVPLIVLPLVLAMLLAGGLAAVLVAASNRQDTQLTQVQGLADAVLPLVADSLQSAMAPAQLLAAQVQQTPGPQLLAAANTTQQLVDLFTAQVQLGPAVRCMALLYAGRPVLLHPGCPPEMAALLSQLDTLHPSSTLFAGSQVAGSTLAGMTSGEITRADVLDSLGDASAYARLLPVFVPASGPNDTWGWPAANSATGCTTGALPCYNQQTGNKWWGQVLVVYDKQALLGPLLHELELRNYGYQLSRAPQAGSSGSQATPLVLAASAFDQCQSPVVHGSYLAALSAAPHKQYDLQVCITSGWQVGWRVPLVVLVVVVSLLLVGLLALAVHRWRSHSQLVQSLLPADLLQSLTKDQGSGLMTLMNNGITLGTPAERLVALLQLLLAGGTPAVQDLLALLSDVQQRHDFYALDADGVLEVVQQAAGTNEEVAAALLLQLVDERHHGSGETTSLIRTETNNLPDQRMLSCVFKSGACARFLPLAQQAPPTQPDFRDVYEALGHITGTPEGITPADSQEPKDTPTFNPSVPTPLPSAKLPASLPMRPSMQHIEFEQVHKDEVLTSFAFQPRRGSLDEQLASGSRGLAGTGSFLIGTLRNAPSFGYLAQPSMGVVSQLEEVLCDAGCLDGSFSAWELEEASRGHPLSALGYWVFDQSGLLKEFNIHGKRLARFLRKVESGYRDNPYHNKVHAADVLQSVHAMLHRGGLAGTYADPFSVLACYLAAIMHDFEHQGVTNDYLVTTRHKLALRYNDRSPHENHHVSAGWQLLAHPECNFLAHLSPGEWARLRKLVIDLVLVTDMKQHFALVGQFNAMHRAARPSQGLALKLDARPSGAKPQSPGGGSHNSSSQPLILLSGEPPRQATAAALSTAFADRTTAGHAAAPGMVHMSMQHAGHAAGPNLVHMSMQPAGHATGPGMVHMSMPIFPGPARPAPPPQGQRLSYTGGLQPNSQTGAVSGPLPSSTRLAKLPAAPLAPLDDVEALLALQLMLKCSDLGHVCAARPVHLKWVAALEEELFRQGDAERELGLSCSPLCDRHGQGVTKSQVGFFDVVVLPLLQAFTARFTATRPILEAATDNYKYWKAMANNDSSP